MIRQDIVKFVRDVFCEPTEFIPLHDPRFIGNERKYLMDCIDSNFVSSVGEFVNQFEHMCAKYTGAQYAVAAVNGTSALHIALILAGVQTGDEVITQPLTFIATANAISYVGAIPVFVDVDKDTMGLSPHKMEAFLLENAEVREDGLCYNKKTNRRIRACVPMHTFGHPVKLDQLVKLCTKYQIELVEDAAESIGSYYKGKHTGIYGKLGILSFNGNKVITTGGGGMILTNNEELAHKAKHITTQAKVPHRWEFAPDSIGYNYRLTNLSAALGCAQIESLDTILGLKRKLAMQYKSFFKDSDYQFFDEPEDCKSNFWLNAILVKDRKERDELLSFTNDNGVMTRPIWQLMNKLPMFQHCQCSNIENSEWFADRVVNLPSSAIVPNYRK